MSLKILGGEFKGKILLGKVVSSTRPTSVILRRKLFDRYQDLSGVIFCDLCAGSGAMGLEAFSRGAAQVYLNELNPLAAKGLSKNIKLFNSHQLHESKLDFLTFLKVNSWVVNHLNKVILFFDPPYAQIQLYQKFSQWLDDSSFPGEVWLESDSLKGLSIEECKSLFPSLNKFYEHNEHYIAVKS